jgi:hypothetical protein
MKPPFTIEKGSPFFTTGEKTVLAIDFSYSLA